MAYVVVARPRAPHALSRRLFHAFHGFAASRVLRARHARVVPRELVDLGRLCAVIYESDRGRRGRPRRFIHFMETPPRLACDPRGRQLFIVGGTYRVTRRGIEG